MSGWSFNDFDASGNAGHLWVAILAGGEGSRMRPAIRQALGEDIPKQYCTFAGRRSMIQHTMDRALALTDPERIVTVIGKGQRPFLKQALPSGIPGMVFEQPANRGTAAGAFLAASCISARDAQATVVILPSDSFVDPEPEFLRYVRQARQKLEDLPDRMILLGAEADRVETDYGWIETEKIRPSRLMDGVADGVLPIRNFHEKPSRSVACDLFEGRGLWNTMVMAAKVSTLWEIGKQAAPELLNRFEMMRCIFRAIEQEPKYHEHVEIALQHIYRQMITCDISRDILMHAAARTSVLPMLGVNWSDWGRPERVMESLRRLNAQPAFPMVFGQDGDESPLVTRRHGAPCEYAEESFA